jgi:carboxymethylenebutenolidase
VRRQIALALALIAVAIPAAAQEHDHGKPQQAAPQQAVPPAQQPVKVPEKMKDSIPPAQEFVATALEKSPRHHEWVDIKVGDGSSVRSFVAYPEKNSKTGVVIVIHENRGLNDWARAVADQLAEDGFIAIAPDMLSGMGPDGGNTDAIPADQATSYISKITNEIANKRLDAVRFYAQQIPAANGRVGVVGFCWGGARVFNYAVHQQALAAGVVYYGTAPQDPALLDRIAAPLLGLFGEDDARVNNTVNAALPILNKDRKRLDAHIFRGAGHAFLRQQYGRKANLEASEDAWPLTIEFFKRHLQ